MPDLITVTNTDDQLIGVANTSSQGVGLSNDPAVIVGTNDHNALINKNDPNQHTISAITGLREELDEIPEVYATKSELNTMSSDKSYIHRQSSAARVWKITHGLDKFPSVTVTDSAESVVIGDVVYVNKDELEVHFNGEFSGKAYLN